MIEEPDLTRIGLKERISLRVRATDQATPWHKRFYTQFPKLRNLYQRFLEEVVTQYIPDPFLFQSVPNLRVHLPDNLAVGEFHTDRMYGHPAGEITVWIPLTPAFGSNTLMLETAPGRRDYVPVEAEPGSAVVFDALNLEHGNVLNITGQSRVSLDFRCLPAHLWTPTPSTSVNMFLQFSAGSYYSLEPMSRQQ
jgi:hypothetical protein